MSQENNKHPPIPWPESNGVWATYDLHCHCGAIKYKMRLSPPLYEEQTKGKERYEVVQCDCSICERNGYLMVHPLAENVEFTQGAEDRSFYRFAAKRAPHWFCRNCGSSLGADLSSVLENSGMPGRYCVNIRMLKDYDQSKLVVVPKPGMKSVGPKYEAL